jgi:spore coat polysaccharide biosynthesis protein SpsF
MQNEPPHGPATNSVKKGFTRPAVFTALQPFSAATLTAMQAASRMVAVMKSDVSKLVLGTVQIGTPYGAANRAGLPDLGSAVALLRRAQTYGIAALDTARAYGEAEARIAAAFDQDNAPRTITKLDPLVSLSAAASEAEAEEAADASVELSLETLKRERLDTLLLHRAAHLTSHNGAVWKRLRRIQRAGLIGRLGVSVQSPEEAVAALAAEGVEHIQLPFNILDQRWREAGIAGHVRVRRDLTVHARSIYLQGLLAAEDPSVWPAVEGCDPEGTLYMLDVLAQLYGRISIADLCLAYVRGQDWIDGVVIGMETEDQLDRNMALFASRPLSAAEIADLEPRLPRFPETLLNPALWPKRT